MAPSNGTTSTPPKLVVTLPPNHSTLQWHRTMAPSNGTASIAHYNSTLVPRAIRQSGSSPSPLIGSKNPYSYHYLGNEGIMNHEPNSRPKSTPSKNIWWFFQMCFSLAFLFFKSFCPGLYGIYVAKNVSNIFKSIKPPIDSS